MNIISTLIFPYSAQILLENALFCQQNARLKNRFFCSKFCRQNLSKPRRVFLVENPVNIWCFELVLLIPPKGKKCAILSQELGKAVRNG